MGGGGGGGGEGGQGRRRGRGEEEEEEEGRKILFICRAANKNVEKCYQMKYTLFRCSYLWLGCSCG